MAPRRTKIMNAHITQTPEMRHCFDVANDNGHSMTVAVKCEMWSLQCAGCPFPKEREYAQAI